MWMHFKFCDSCNGENWHDFFNNLSFSAGRSSGVGQGTVFFVLCSASSFSFVSSCHPHPGLPVLRGLTASVWSEICFPPLTSPLGTAAPGLQHTRSLLAWSQLSSSQQQAWSSPALWESLPGSERWGRNAPTKIPVRKQSSCLTYRQGAGLELISVCADRWSDLKYSLQIPLSPGKAAGS